MQKQSLKIKPRISTASMNPVGDIQEESEEKTVGEKEEKTVEKTVGDKEGKSEEKTEGKIFHWQSTLRDQIALIEVHSL